MAMDKLLTSDRTIEFARAAARQFSESRLRLALHNAEPQSPTLVQRIDHKDAYYFIVPFNIATRETARLIIDAFSGRLVEVSGVTEANKSLQRYVSSQEALDRMLTARAASKLKWQFEFRREHVGVHPVLVWKPCRQSVSPFLPFHQFSVGSSLVYLRVDGQLFNALKTGPT
jgi:hypothetical protein